MKRQKNAEKRKKRKRNGVDFGMTRMIGNCKGIKEMI